MVMISPPDPQFCATVYTQITETIDFLAFAPLAPQFWGENSEKVPQTNKSAGFPNKEKAKHPLAPPFISYRVHTNNQDNQFSDFRPPSPPILGGNSKKVPQDWGI